MNSLKTLILPFEIGSCNGFVTFYLRSKKELEKAFDRYTHLHYSHLFLFGVMCLRAIYRKRVLG